MKISDLNIKYGENSFQKARIEENDKIIDYETSNNLTYIQLISISKGLELISEFYDVNSVCTVKGNSICAVALGQTVNDAVKKVLDSDSIDFINSTVVISSNVESDTAKFFKEGNVVVAPEFTQNSKEIMELHGVIYVTIKTPLKDYKKYLSDETKITPLGTLIQEPNLSELDKDTFKVVSKQKPTVEQIEDAVFAWKVAKHTNSQSIVIAKDLKTSAIAQNLQAASVEYALDYSCDMSKDAILASDMPISVHDVDVASQGRVALIIVPSADKDVIDRADKYSTAVITTGFTNIRL